MSGWDAVVSIASARRSGEIETSSLGSRDPLVSRVPLAVPRPTRELAEAAGPQPPAPVPAHAPKPAPAGAGDPAEGGAAQRYCINIADAAADARFAWQKKTLNEIERELDRRIALLESKAAEYREWLARRDEFARKAQDTLVRIYARMRPDAAASQLVAMDEETAAAVLTKLDPRNASAILNEMPAGAAARLTATIAGAAKVSTEPEPRPAATVGGRKS
jgi:flagellar motility protein MotE (MotC chaperone)